jgi:hypothetical protein
VHGIVQAFRRSDLIAATAINDEGRYQLTLPAASYDLRVEVHDLARCQSKTIAVTDGRQVVDFDCTARID